MILTSLISSNFSILQTPHTYKVLTYFMDGPQAIGVMTEIMMEISAIHKVRRPLIYDF
jgi:predicted alpha/beta superfamily hydrolase